MFLFLTIQSINRAIIRDPVYGAVFVADYFPSDRYKPYTVLIEHGKLVIKKNQPEPGSNIPLDYSQVPSLFFFDPATLKYLVSASCCGCAPQIISTASTVTFVSTMHFVKGVFARGSSITTR